MRRSGVCLLAAATFVGSLSCAAATPTSPDVEQLTARAGEAVWLVDALGCGWSSKGTAFAIDRRHLVTNRHVVANDSSPTIRSRAGRRLTGRVIGAVEDPDVAVIEVSQDLPKALDWAPTDALSEREPLVVLGYPRPAHRFTVSTGRIVRFEEPHGFREAALANAPVEKGNSGGPGLRSDAHVAGVVTQMTLRDKPEERVAILLTAQAVRSQVGEFLREPREVLSSCGLGPDYVPPVPKRYEIDAPPPTPEAAEAVLVPTPPPTARALRAAARTSTPTARPPQWTPAPSPPCPQGRAMVAVDDVQAAARPAEPGWWDVTVSGTVRNDATYAVWAREVTAEIAGEPPAVLTAVPEQETLAPGDETTWFGSVAVYSPEREPSSDTTTATLDWRWSQGNYGWCPTG